MRPKYINNKSELTVFERRIVDAHPHNLVSTIVEGNRGIGKSMFSYKVGTRIFQFLEGIHVDDAYLRALDHMKFTLPEVLAAIDKVIDNTDMNDINKYDYDNKYRILIVDDAGSHMSSYKFFTDIYATDDLKGRLDVIRDVCSGMIFTTPTKKGLLSFLRDYPDNKTATLTYNKKSHGDYGRIISIREQKRPWARQGRLWCPPIATSIWVDDWAFEEYKRRKRKAIQTLFQSKHDDKHEFKRMVDIAQKLNPDLSNDDIIKKLDLSDMGEL